MPTDFPWAAGIILLAVWASLLWVAYTYGRHVQSNFDRRYELRLTEKIMASLARLEAAAQAIIAALNAARANQEDPATQAKADQIAADLEAAAQPTSPPA